MFRRLIRYADLNPFLFFMGIVLAIHIVEYLLFHSLIVRLSKVLYLDEFVFHILLDFILLYPIIYWYIYRPFSRKFQFFKHHQRFMREKAYLMKKVASEQSLLATTEELRYKTLFEMIGDAVFLYPVNTHSRKFGNFQQVNEAAIALLGYTRYEFSDMSPDQIDVDHTQCFIDRFNQLISTNHIRLRSQYRHKDGHLIDVDVNGRLFECNGEPHLLCIVRDITEQSSKENQLQILSQTVEQTADFIVITDLDGVITYINDAHLKVLQFDRSEVIGQKPSLFKSGEYTDSYYKGMWNTILSGKPYKGSIKNKCKDGSFYYEEITITPLRDSSGNIIGFVSTGKDITDRVMIEQELHENQKLFQTLAENAVSGVFLYQNKCIYANPAFCDFIGYSLEELMEMNMADLIAPDMRETIMQHVIERINDFDTQKHVYEELKVIDKAGHEKWVYVATNTIMYKGKLTGIATTVDITDKKIFEAQLLAYATTDPLTGAYNRRKFDEIVVKEIASAKRHDYEISIMFIDIDYFKQINDVYGHEIGDDILIHLVKIMNATIRDNDLLFRWGGEEFIILMTHTPLDSCERFAERLRILIENYPFESIDKVTISIGISEHRLERDIKETLEAADKALYQAKNEGRNRVVVNAV